MVVDISTSKPVLPIFLPLLMALDIQRQILNFWFPVHLDAQVYLFKKRIA